MFRGGQGPVAGSQEQCVCSEGVRVAPLTQALVVTGEAGQGPRRVQAEEWSVVYWNGGRLTLLLLPTLLVSSHLPCCFQDPRRHWRLLAAG